MKPKYWNKGIVHLSNKDKVLKSIIASFSNENLKLNKNYYHSLIDSIIGQQISVSAANSIKKKFFKLHNNIIPKNVINFNQVSLSECGLSRQKILYIKNISNYFILNKDFFKKIDNFTEEEIKEKLILIKGVGNWTVDMFLLFSFGSSNIFPQGDLGFIKAISILYKKKLPLSEMYLKKLNKKWSPYSSVATWYLWKFLD